MRWLLILLMLAFVQLPSVVMAQPAPGTTGVTAFGAKAEVTTKAAPDDWRALLASCNEQHEACEKDAVGVPFLAAAYMALWVILIAFLMAVRSGTNKTRLELAELRARVRELEGAAP